MFNGIVYDVVHTRLEQIMWDGSVQGRKIECLNGSCSMDSIPSDLKMTVNLWNS